MTTASRPASGFVPGAGRASHGTSGALTSARPGPATGWPGASAPHAVTDEAGVAAGPLEPTTPGRGVGGTPVLDDHDVVDEHRIRRARLGNALRRGTTTPWPGPTWRTTTVGIVLAALALGGTAVGSAVHRHLPGARPASAGATHAPGASGDATQGGSTDPGSQEARTAPSSSGRSGSGSVPSSPTPGTPEARPYGSWIAPGAGTPPGQNGDADQTSR